MPAVAVHDDDPGEPVAGDLLAGRVEQLPDQPARERKRPGLVARLVDLAVEIIREHDGILGFRRARCDLTDLNQIRAYRTVRSVLLENPDWQDRRARRFLQRPGP